MQHCTVQSLFLNSEGALLQKRRYQTAESWDCLHTLSTVALSYSCADLLMWSQLMLLANRGRNWGGTKKTNWAFLAWFIYVKPGISSESASFFFKTTPQIHHLIMNFRISEVFNHSIFLNAFLLLTKRDRLHSFSGWKILILVEIEAGPFRQN